MLRRLAGPLALALVATLVALGAAELVLRAFWPQHRPGAIWAMTRDGLAIHPPGAEAYLLRQDRVIHTNAFGMRDRPHSVEKPPGVFRIVLLGDSFMEAFQVDFEDALASLLEEQLARGTDREIEVINAAVSGWGTDQQLTWLKRYGLRFEPDLVLVAMTLHNDVLDNLRQTFHHLEDGELVERPRIETPWLSYHWSRLKARCTALLHLCALAYHATRQPQVGEAVRELDSHVVGLLRKRSPPRIVHGWDLTRALLDETRQVARQSGARTAVFLIPLAIQLSEARLGRFLQDHGLAPEAVALERPQAQVRAWGERVGVPVIDLLPAFRRRVAHGAGPFYLLPGDGHWNEAGHALAAEAVARELAEQGVVSGPTSSAEVQ